MAESNVKISRKEYLRLYRIRNKDALCKYQKEYRECNKDAIKERNKKYSDNNKDYYREYQKNHRDVFNKRNAERVLIDPKYKITCVLRSRLSSALKTQKSTKSDSTIELLGCDVKCCIRHLENQFKPGMTWENHGIDGWHIDHIKPCDSFDLTKPDEQLKCFNYTNLQPLWAKDNLSKGNKYIA